MSATDRLLTEQAFHDCQARARSDTFARQPQQLLRWLYHGICIQRER